MDIKQLNSLAELLEKGILNQDEFNREKAKIMAVSNKQEAHSDFASVSKAGQNLLNIFYALFALVVYAVIAVTLVFIDYSYYQTVFLISLFVQLLVFIIIFSNIYLAGKHLKYSATAFIASNRVSLSEKAEYDEHINNLKEKEFGHSKMIRVENHCPACSFDLTAISNANNLTECPNCGLNFN
jgi:hypothetical protein